MICQFIARLLNNSNAMIKIELNKKLTMCAEFKLSLKKNRDRDHKFAEVQCALHSIEACL